MMLIQHSVNFPRVILLWLYSSQPKPQKKPRRPHTTGPKPHQLKTPTTQSKTRTPKPQFPNHNKWLRVSKNEKKVKRINLGKNIVFNTQFCKLIGLYWKLMRRQLWTLTCFIGLLHEVISLSGFVLGCLRWYVKNGNNWPSVTHIAYMTPPQ